MMMVIIMMTKDDNDKQYNQGYQDYQDNQDIKTIWLFKMIIIIHQDQPRST